MGIGTRFLADSGARAVLVDSTLADNVAECAAAELIHP